MFVGADRGRLPIHHGDPRISDEEGTLLNSENVSAPLS
jgi:hypothetical protein